MKTFITGATGYIGQQLAMKLACMNYQVNALVRNPDADNVPVHPNIQLFKGDINDSNSINTAISGCETAYHVAGFARLGNGNSDAFYRINVEGTEKVLEQALEVGVKKIVYTSSVAVLGHSMIHPLTEDDPRVKTFENDYELTKSLAEKLVKKYNGKGLPGVIVSLSRVYGPGIDGISSGVNKFISMALNNRRLIVPDRQQVEANYVFIEDVIHGHLLAMSKGLPGEKYILGGENASFEKLFKTIAPLTGKKVSFIKIPYNLLKACCYIISVQSRIAAREPSLSPSILDQLFTNRKVSSAKAINELGYQITPLTSGIEQTIRFLKSRSHGSN
jgi:nucleoside-diphosphate-sugar epimerase